ncbi:MAG: hypothetical protein QM765_19925 [Myxococcales bacterium]
MTTAKQATDPASSSANSDSPKSSHVESEKAAPKPGNNHEEVDKPEQGDSTESSQWHLIGEELWQRLRKPSTMPLALLYLVVAVLAIGGLSTWITIVDVVDKTATAKDLAVSVKAYALAMSVAACADAFLDRSTPHWMKFIFLCFGLVYWFIVLPIAASLLVSAGQYWVYKRGLALALIPMILFWWFLNGSDQRFVLEVHPEDAVGGPAMERL